MRVLIVEDEAMIRRMVGEQLERRGVGIVSAGTVAASLEALEHEDFHAIILDLGLPDGSGLDILAELRASGSSTHVIVLTGAGSEADRIHAIESGADDVVVKPFSVRELAARVLAVERRRSLSEDLLLRIGPLEIDLKAREVVSGDRTIELTSMEFDLLAFLAARTGQTFSRAELLRAVWKSSAEWQQSATVTEHMRRLRTKIETDPRHPEMLKTVRGVGYRMDAPEPRPGEKDSRNAAVVGAGVVIHVDGHIVAADAVAVEILGYSSDEDVLGRHLFDFVASASLDEAAERFEVTGAGDSRRSEVMTLERSDGSEVIVEVGSSTITWEGERAGRVELVVAPDSSARLRHVVTDVHRDLSDAVIVTDLRFHIRSWNEAAAQLLGSTEEEVLGHHLLDVFDWEGDDLSGAAKALEATGRWEAEGRQRIRDGSVVDVTSSMTTILDENGEAIGIVSVNRPVPTALDQVDGPVTPDAAELRRALDTHQFEVHYQPVVALADGSLQTVEALVRWQHPARGRLGPDSFIEAIERNGMIVELGVVILDIASRQVASWRHRGADVDLSVNVSAAELADPGFVGRIIETIDAAGLEPDALWLEVAETSLVRDIDRAAAKLHRLADLGVRIAIDDFSAGWASLASLSKFPIRALKIDRIFVAGIDENANDRAIAKSILQLGAELGLDVVAEGIETVAQCDALQALGCVTGQGYLFGRPTPADAVPLDLASGTDGSTADSIDATARTPGSPSVESVHTHLPPPTDESANATFVDEVEQFIALVGAGRSQPAIMLALQLLDAGHSVEDVIVGVVTPTRREVGRRWRARRWSTAQEHAATAVTEGVIGAIAVRTPVPAATRGAILVSCVEEEDHSLTARITAELLRCQGWDVTFLGVGVPSHDLAAFAASKHVDAVVLSCTAPLFLPGARRAIAALADVGVPAVAVGDGFGETPRRASQLGASGWIGPASDSTAVLAGLSAGATGVHRERADEAVRFELHADELREGIVDETSDRIAAMSTLSPRQLAQTRETLSDILTYLGVALDLDEPAIFEDFVGWLSNVMAGRDIPSAVLVETLDCVTEVTRHSGFGRAADLCGSARAALAAT